MSYWLKKGNNFLSGFLFEKPDDGGSGEGEPKGHPPAPPSPNNSEQAKGEESTPPKEGNDTPQNSRISLADDPDLADAMAATEKAHGIEPEDGNNTPPADKSPDSPEGENKTKDESGNEDEAKDEAEVKVEGETVAGFEEDDLVEVGEDTFFYHPEEHGKDTGQGTTYKSRDAAEHGFANKVAKIKDDLQKLKETELGVGPVELPEWVEKALSDPDTLDDFMAVDYAIQQPNGDLRTKIKEADRVITQFNNRQEQLSSKKAVADNKQKLDELTDTAFENAAIIRNELNYSDEELESFADVDALQADMQAKIDKKIASELEDEVEAYKDLMNADLDKRSEDGYAKELDQKKTELMNKERDLRDQYNKKYFNSLQEMQDAHAKAQELQQGLEKKSGMSTKELQKKQEAGYMDLQDFMANLPQDQQPAWFRASSPEGMKDFWTFAVNRASKFESLTDGFHWRKAAKAYSQHLKDMRAKVRKQQIEAENEKQAKTKNDMPGYGDQEQISPGNKNKKPRDKRSALRTEMEELEAETEQALG